jgi:hypothetical protein
MNNIINIECPNCGKPIKFNLDKLTYNKPKLNTKCNGCNSNVEFDGTQLLKDLKKIGIIKK